ncbi:MAG: M23 family metallopeptidase [Cytophagales bacterium]|nr:M23 family metallopeptidase [Cytophagales bacterium]
MMLVLLSLLFFSTQSRTQSDVTLSSENKEGGFILFARNDAYCPMSVAVTVQLENLQQGDGKQDLYVVPARTEKFRLMDLNVIDPKKKAKFGTRVKYNRGNTNQHTYEEGHAYQLPFERGKNFMVFQGYNGEASHRGINALDFTMPEGTEIFAARGGTVISVEAGNSRSCPEEECKKYNNYIVIYHSDGTMAEYTHLRKEGALVKVGDVVKTGDRIGYSGNTGWTTGPHLHFVCFLPRMDSRETIQTKFLVDDGMRAVLLEEKSSYSRSN